MKRLALILLFSCDSPFYEFVEEEPQGPCNWAVDVRCNTRFPGRRPLVTVSPKRCEMSVDATNVDPRFAFNGRITDGEIVLDPGLCTAEPGLEVRCDYCTFSFVEAAPLPHRVARSSCTVDDCDTSLRPFIEYNRSRLPFDWISAGYLADLTVDPPIFVARSYEDRVRCPIDRGVEYGFIETSNRIAGEPCLHRLERAEDAYVGVYGGDVLRVGRFSPEDLTLLASRPLELGEPGNIRFTATAMTYAPNDSVLIALTATSTAGDSQSAHLVLADASSLMVLDHRVLRGLHHVYGIAWDEGSWLYADDGDDTLNRISGNDLDVVENVISFLDLLGRSELGAMVATEKGSIVINTFDEELVIVEQNEAIGTAGSITDRVATPTAIEWAGDLIAVGLLDRAEDDALIAFFDPNTSRYLPGAIPVGKGVVGRIRFTGDSLWIMLPWQGMVVELDADPR